MLHTGSFVRHEVSFEEAYAALGDALALEAFAARAAAEAKETEAAAETARLIEEISSRLAFYAATTPEDEQPTIPVAPPSVETLPSPAPPEGAADELCSNAFSDAIEREIGEFGSSFPPPEEANERRWSLALSAASIAAVF